MSTPILGLDHLGVISRNLDDLADAYSRMGFQLTPKSQHSGSLVPGGPVVPMGTGNRCAMFQTGYLELLAIVDPSLNVDRVETFLARYEGIHINAFRCEDSPAAQRHLVEAGFDVPDAHLLERMAETAQGPQKVSFRNLRVSQDELPEAFVIVIKHETPALLWEPHLLTHPNGALALTEILVCVADVAASAARFQRLFGVAGQGDGERTQFDLPHGRYVLTGEAGLAAEIPGATAPTLPFVAAFTLSVEDAGVTADLLSENGVPFQQSRRGLFVPAAAARGATVCFEQA